MAYLKIADTEFGELGHNGWTWVLNHPFSWEDRDHPAYYEETGVLTVAPNYALHAVDELRAPRVLFAKIYGVSRGGLTRDHEILIPVTLEQVHIAHANRDAHDAIHMPPGGYKVIVD